MKQLLIYGANGYTGRLIAAEGARAGLQPILGGRNREALDEQGRQLDCRVRAFALDDVGHIANGLDGVRVVLHCAGPFSRTAAPMLEACLQRKVHYLDITGEIDVFRMCHDSHQRAVTQGIVVLPGAGFDVVPTDCVAAMLARRVPDATSLILAFEAGGGPSPGTAKTSVEGLAGGGRARIDGKLVRVPLAWKTRTFERDGKARTAMTIPWGDLYTAWVTTGIANIETYMTVSPKTIRRLRWLRHLRPILALPAVQRFMQRRIDRHTPGPSAQRRGESASYVWGEVRNAAGEHAHIELSAPNGYDLTVSASLGIARHLLSAPNPRGGYFTPSQLMGADYVLQLPGVHLIGQA